MSKMLQQEWTERCSFTEQQASELWAWPKQGQVLGSAPARDTWNVNKFLKALQQYPIFM